MSKSPSMSSSGVTAQKKAFLELIEWHACSPVVLQINDGAKAIQDVLEEMGCSVGEYNMNALEREDNFGCGFASVKRRKHQNMKRSRGRSGREEVKAGKNKLWMKKVQPTKLGPSEQLFANIFGISCWKWAVLKQNLPPKVVQI